MATQRFQPDRCPFPIRPTFRLSTRSRAGSVVWVVLVVVLVVAAVIAGIWYAFRDRGVSDKDGPILHAAKRDMFDHIVLEQGEIESSSNVDVLCEIKSRSMGTGGVAILWVIDEGARVQKGDKLVELDSSGLEHELKAQRNIVNSSLALKISAEAALQQATIAKQEYLEGTFTTEEKLLLSEIAVAQQELRKAQLKQLSGERLAAKGLVNSLQLEAEQFAVQNARNVLDSGETRLRVLRDLTKRKMLVQFDSDIETARARVESDTKIYEEELDKMADLQDQIAKCHIVAPDDGVVVHSNRYSSRGGSAEFVVEAGAVVRERQTIIRLPDPNQMQVRAKINESQVSLVREGMPVRIKIGATEGTELNGIVTKVNKYAEPSSWYSSQVKEFATFIKILDPPPTIRTGMTAEARILVDHKADALQIPVQAVQEHRGRTFCLVKKGDQWETREIKIGASNDKAVTIDEGLSDGEIVVLNPRRHLDLFQLPDIPAKTSTNIAAFRQYQESGASGEGLATSESRRPDPVGAEGRGPSERPSGGGRPQPQEMVDRTFQNFDTDGDGRLSAEELQRMPEQVRERALQADANGDGIVDRAELLSQSRTQLASDEPERREGEDGESVHAGGGGR